MRFVQLKLSQAFSERLSATVAKTTHDFFEDSARSMPQPAIGIAVYLPVAWRPLPSLDANGARSAAPFTICDRSNLLS